MIHSISFIDNYELIMAKESQKRFKYKTIKPDRYSREKEPYKVFYLFEKGLKIHFDEDIIIIVGENGSGKSTLFSLIKHYAGEKETNPFIKAFTQHTEEESIELHKKNYQGELSIESDVPLTYKNTVFFSAEKDNPTVAIPDMLDPGSKNFALMVNELFEANEESHGESLLPILKFILQNATNMHIFLDEPDTALSLKNQIWLAKAIKKSTKDNHNQIFVSTHALALINQFECVYDMEKREWRFRDKYVEEIIKK